MMMLYDDILFNVIYGNLIVVYIVGTLCFIRRNTLFPQAKHFVSADEIC